MLLQLAVPLEQNQALGISKYSEQNSSVHWDKQELHFSTVNKSCAWDVIIKKNIGGFLPSVWLGFRGFKLIFLIYLGSLLFYIFNTLRFYLYRVAIDFLILQFINFYFRDNNGRGDVSERKLLPLKLKLNGIYL